MSDNLPVVVKAQPVYSGAGSKAPFYWFADIDRERLGWEAREKVLTQLKEEAEKENVVLKQKIKEQAHLLEDALAGLGTRFEIDFEEDKDMVAARFVVQELMEIADLCAIDNWECGEPIFQEGICKKHFDDRQNFRKKELLGLSK